ncbi:MAG: hypothetical protein IJW22_10065, partial [Clostridia bacterium]|nr:hypothetical protein [Clostridia bacterium]
MKRTISLLLCLCMLFVAVALFSSCKKEYTGEPDVSKKKIDVDLSGYTLVYPSSISTQSQERVREFAQSFRTVIGATVRAAKDNGTSNGKEILVGNVEREETRAALEDIKGHGYTIRVLEDKIVIVGTNYIFTELALRFFAENYLSGNSSGNTTLSINKKVHLENVPTLTLTSDGAHHYSFVISHLLDTESGFPQKHWGSPSSASQDVDRPYDLYLSMVKKLGAVSKIKTPVNPVLDTADADANEILFGQVERDECRQVLDSLSANEYGIVVKNGKVVVTAWNDEGLIRAAELFESTLVDALIEDEAGNKSIILPADYRAIYSLKQEESFVTDFPKPEGDEIELIGTASA